MSWPVKGEADQRLGRSPSRAVNGEADQSKNRTSLIINEFPSFFDNALLFELLHSKGFDVESVYGKSKSKKLALQNNKVLYAFVNCSTPEAAQKLKTACDEKRVRIIESAEQKRGTERTWLLRADWAMSNRFRKPDHKKQSKSNSKKPKSEQPATKEVSEEGSSAKLQSPIGAPLTARLREKGRTDSKNAVTKEVFAADASADSFLSQSFTRNFFNW